MKEDRTGGPAFTTKIIQNGEEITILGMTMRDFFAISATDKDVNEYREGEFIPERGGYVVYKYSRHKARYRFADKMLKERQK